MSVVGSAGTVSFKFAVEGIDQVLQGFNLMEQGQKKLTTSVETMRTSLGTAISSALPVGFQQIGEGADQAAAKTQTFTQRMTGFQGNLLTAATSVGTFTASIFGIDAAMDQLTASELSLEQARVRQDRMQTTLQAQELRLNELRTSGTATAAEIAVQEERVNTTRQQLEVQTERVAFQQQNLSEQYAQFGAQILPQVITASLSGVTAFQSIFTLIGKNEKAVGALNKAWTVFSTALKGGGGVTQLTGALTNATPAASGLASAMSILGTVLAGFAIGVAAVGIPMALWITNAFGARDAMSAFGESLGNAVPPLKGFLSTMEFSARLWTNIIAGIDLTADSANRLGEAMDRANKDVGSAIDEISTKLDALKTNVAEMVNAAAPQSGKALFDFLFGGEGQVEKIVAQSDILIGVIDNLGAVLKKGGITDIAPLEQTVTNVLQFSDALIAGFNELGEAAPVLLNKITEAISKMQTDIAAGLLDPNADPLQVYKDNITTTLAVIGDLIVTWGPEFEQKLTDIMVKTQDPINFAFDQLTAKLREFAGTEFNLGAAIMIDPSLVGTIDDVTAAIFKLKAGQEITNAELLLSAKVSVPSWIAAFQKSNPAIDTAREAVEKMLQWVKELGIENTNFGKGVVLLATEMGIMGKDVGATTEKLTEQEMTIQKLAKQYFDLDLQGKENILTYKEKVQAVQDAIQEYDDEIDKLKQLQIEYGSSEQAVYGVNQATQDLIESKKAQILEEQSLTLETINVTKALDGSTESQILMNDAMIEGKTAAADFVTEMAKNEAQTKAYGEALSENVLEVLKKFPENIKQFADEFENLLPNLFQSLSEFEGKIKPFDKQSIKDYKEELKDLDVPKSLRDLYISSAKVWQDKDEIIQEGEALFAGMAGSLVHNFEEIDVEDVTTFLDEIGGRLEELEAEGVGTQFTDNIRQLIDHIKNSADPVQELRDHFDELKGAMDPKAIDTVSTAMQIFGTHIGTLVQDAVLSDLALQGDDATKSLTALSEVDLTNLLDQIRQAQEIQLNKGTSEGLSNAIDLAIAGGDVATALEQKKGATPDDSAKAWEDAKARIETATTGITTAVDTATAQISLSVGQMAATVGTAILANVTSIDGLQTMWSTLDTNLLTYTDSMTTNVQATTDSQTANMLLIGKGIDASKTLWSELSQIVTEASSRMTEDYKSHTDSTAANMLLIGRGIDALKTLWAELSQIVTEASSRMTTDIEAWSEATVTAFDNVKTGAEEATTAVEGLADAIAELKDKKVTITVDVQENSTSSGSNQQYGGAKLLTHPQYIFGGEGHKPELHLTFPLDQMSQSHAKDAFRLPFNIGDLTSSKIGPPTFTGSTSNQAYVPSNLVSNLRLNANLHIDLGNEVRKIVREEINARAVTRLDRMAM